MKIGSLLKDAFILFVITLILGACLSAAKVATQPLVDKAALEAKIKAYNKVCSGYKESKNISDRVKVTNTTKKARLNDGESVLQVYNENNEAIGYIVEVSAKGYGGDLNLIVGFDNDGKITGVSYANTPSETPGVGMKTTKSWFLDSFIGHDADDVSTVDTISGATESSGAFKQAVTLACLAAQNARLGS